MALVYVPDIRVTEPTEAKPSILSVAAFTASEAPGKCACLRMSRSHLSPHMGLCIARVPSSTCYEARAPTARAAYEKQDVT